MKLVRMAPTMNMRAPMNVRYWLKMECRPKVKVPLELERLVPSWLLNRSRKSVEATLKVNVITIKAD
jgi:hypothetical protein